MRRRAIQPEAKAERQQTILDAAWRLWLAHPDRVASMAEFAEAAGLAKGTIYLYFDSKEELLLALYERLEEAFFAAVAERCAQGPLDLHGLLEVTRVNLIEAPGYLPLAAMVQGLAQRQLPPPVVAAFHQRVAQRLARTAQVLLGHLPIGTVEQGAELLTASYALILGLWQMRRPVQDLPELNGVPTLHAITGDYFETLSRMLLALWEGHMARLESAP